MLIVPPNSGTTFSVIGLDPGTTTLGLGVLHVDALSLQITSYEAHTLIATKMVREDDWMAVTHGYREARVRALSDCLLEWFHYLRPLSIATEAAFYNRRTPSAYGPLLEAINGIRNAVVAYDNWMTLHVIETSVAKSEIGYKSPKKVKGQKKDTKTPVKEAMLSMPEFKCPSQTPISTLSEHAIDALAIAYARLNQMR